MNNSDMVEKITKNLIDSLKNRKLTLNVAKNILERAEKKALEINVPVVISIVNKNGILIAQHKMDDSIFLSNSVAFNKAYTAISLKMSTEALYNLSQPGQAFYGIENVEPGKICLFAGGIPILKDGEYIGAIGVSGGTPNEDNLIAKYAIENIV